MVQKSSAKLRYVTALPVPATWLVGSAVQAEPAGRPTTDLGPLKGGLMFGLPPLVPITGQRLPPLHVSNISRVMTENAM